MKIIYRISDNGYYKIKPPYIDNERCLKNFCNIFGNDIVLIADNCSNSTIDMINNYIDPSNIIKVSIGNGAGTFKLALDNALLWDDDEIVYFVENDYIHDKHADKVLLEGFNLGAPFVSLYDHPDKYMDPSCGGNPYCSGGAEETRVYLTQSCHWKITNSTTMTFAAKVSTLKRTESILRKHTSGTHPSDFNLWIDLRKINELLITPIPGYSTHGESAWLSPLKKWQDLC
jgi:hypothetical protein